MVAPASHFGEQGLHASSREGLREILVDCGICLRFGLLDHQDCELCLFVLALLRKLLVQHGVRLTVADLAKVQGFRGVLRTLSQRDVSFVKVLFAIG